MKDILNLFKELIDNIENDFISQEDDITYDYYMNDRVPFRRVLADRNKCVEMLAKYIRSTDNNTEKELVLAIYANFYIKYGMAGRFYIEKKEETYDGLSEIFDSCLPKEMYLQSVYYGIKNQDYNVWKDILAINKDSVVAKIYLFVKLCFDYCQDAKKSDEEVLDVDKYKELWELYESIPEVWKKYLIGEVEPYEESIRYIAHENLLPHMLFRSKNEILMEYIQNLYDGVLNKLGIPTEINSKITYFEVLNKLGVPSIVDYISQNQLAFKEMPVKIINNLDNLNNLNREEIQKFILCTEELIIQIKKSVEQLLKADEEYDMSMLWEKIHELQADESTYWVDCKEEQYKIYEKNPLEREEYLHLPVQGPIKKSLFLSQYNEYLKNRIVKRNIKQKKDMMDYYAHSWKHISYPQIVKEIAEELGSTNRIIANRLMKVYNSEKTLQRGIQLLQYLTSDDDSRISKEFRGGMAKSGVDNEYVLTLEDVICESLDLVVFKILMVESDDSKTIINCREKWETIRTLEDLRNDYTEKFLDKNSNHTYIVDWVNYNFFKIKLSIQNDWKDVRFKIDSFSINQFKEILVELFTNMFLHGNGTMHLEFFDNDTEMIIREENECNDTISGSKSGISSMERVLDYINYDTDIDSIQTKKEEKYEITIRINKKLMIRRGR